MYGPLYFEQPVQPQQTQLGARIGREFLLPYIDDNRGPSSAALGTRADCRATLSQRIFMHDIGRSIENDFVLLMLMNMAPRPVGRKK